MPEQIIQSQQPLRDAIAKVLDGDNYTWRLTGWTTPGKANSPTKIADTLTQGNATSGMRGVATHKTKGTSRNFTIRHDYDFAAENDPDVKTKGKGKGYHVNVELPNEKYAFCSPTLTENYYSDCVQMLSERRLHDGDDLASRWFMKAD